MAGHSKWAKVKHQKAVTDVKKGKIFSKISRLITIAARKGIDPESNPSLRYAINKAKEVNMPSEKIEKAIKKASGGSKGEKLEEVLYEAFSQDGVAILIKGITDNKNRTLNEIKQLLNQYKAKLAEPGSATWAFEKTSEGNWKAKTLLEIPEESKKILSSLINALQEREDIQSVSINAALD